MRKFQATDFSGQLDVIASLGDKLFSASLDQLRARDEMILGLRDALRLGMPIDELSARTGFPPDQIRSLACRNLTFGEDLAAITGNAR